MAAFTPIPPVPARGDIDALVRAHTATLDWAASVTDFPSTIARIATLRSQVARYATMPNTGAGLLGHNSIGPAVEDVAKSASFHGFGWRERSFAA